MVIGKRNSSEDDASQMKILGIHRPSSRRRKQLAIFATIVAFLLIMTVLWQVFLPGKEGTEHPVSRGVEFDILAENGNWSMTVTYTPSGLNLTDATLTIRNESGVPAGMMHDIVLFDLTPANWNLYRVIYQKAGTETTVAVGARILIDATTYPTGFRFELFAESTQVASGFLE